MTKQRELRRPSGGRLSGTMLASRLAADVRGMVLAQAYVTVRSAGCDLRVSKLDGVPQSGRPDEGQRDDRINVSVVGGLVKQCWVG